MARPLPISLPERMACRATLGLSLLLAACTRYEVAVLAGDAAAPSFDAGGPEVSGADGGPPRGLALDPSFGARGSGVAQVELAAEGDEAIALIPREGGGIIAAATADCAIAAFTRDGQLDGDFGQSGIARAPQGCTGFAAIAHGAGVIVAGGSNASGQQGIAYRYDAAGAIDFGFAQGGVALLKEQSRAAALTSTPGDGVAVVGAMLGTTKEDGADFTLARLRKDGSRDPAFAAGVRRNSGAIDVPVALLSASDGALVYVGDHRSPTGATAVVLGRFTADGAAAAGFGEGGILLVPVRRGQQRIVAAPLAADLQADGAILVAGWAAEEGSKEAVRSDLLIIRADRGGKLDQRFGTEGVVLLDGVAGGSESLVALTRLPDGKILALGNRRPEKSGPEAFLLRLLPDGAPDGTFGTGGFFPLRFAPSVQARTLALTADGKILVAGAAGPSDIVQSLFVARLAP